MLWPTNAAMLDRGRYSSTLPKVEELIRLLDRKTPEVEIEARVVAVHPDVARDIGHPSWVLVLPAETAFFSVIPETVTARSLLHNRFLRPPSHRL